MTRHWGPIALALLLGLTLAAGSLALDGERGLQMLLDLRLAVEEHQSLVAGLEQERARLSAHIRGLREDPLELEAVARERLGMVRPGELVVRWDVDPATVSR